MDNNKPGIKLLTGLILFACFPVFSHAQQVIIEGTVTDSANAVPLFPATVFNKTSGVATYADSLGHYLLNAHPGDEIEYSYLGYNTEKYIVPNGLQHIIHDVKMISKKERLKEVVVHSWTQYQLDSIERSKTFKSYMDEPKVTTINKQGHSVYSQPNPNYNDGFGIELNPFSLFSRKNKNKRKFDKTFPEMEQQSFINSRYTPELVTKLTGLTGDSLSLFLYHFRPTYEFTRRASDLEFWSWIKIEYRAWTKPK